MVRSHPGSHYNLCFWPHLSTSRKQDETRGTSEARPHRLSVRTLGFHPSRQSSTLCGVTSGESSNGRTTVFGAVYWGSNPCSPAICLRNFGLKPKDMVGVGTLLHGKVG